MLKIIEKIEKNAFFVNLFSKWPFCIFANDL